MEAGMKAWWETGWAVRLPWIMTIVAIMLLASSFFLGLSPLLYLDSGLSPPAPKERIVGFAPALNWSFTYVVLTPFALRLLIQFIKELRYTTYQLGACGMLYDKRGHKLPDKALFDKWFNRQSQRDMYMGIILLVALAINMWEWWDYSAQPLLCAAGAEANSDLVKQCGGLVQEGEFDWAVAALFAEGVNPYVNMAFSFFAFLLKTIMYTIIVGAFVYVALFSNRGPYRAARHLRHAVRQGREQAAR